MAKRFTDTDKWKDPWFEDLSGIAKLFFFYFLDNCDCAGVWKGSFKQFTFLTSFAYSKEQMKKDFEEKITALPNGSFFMPNFIKVQYNTLSTESTVHRGVFKSLRYNNIESNPFVSLTESFGKGSVSIKDKNKDKDKDKVKDKNKYVGSFDLEKIYQAYPKKEGKKNGLERLSKIVTSQEIYDQVFLAVNNYAQSCKGKDLTYVKMFSSFVSVWTDYLEIQVSERDQAVARIEKIQQDALEKHLAELKVQEMANA